MAADPRDFPRKYQALMERNKRPVTAETLLRLAKAYKVDFSDFGEQTAPDLIARLRTVMRDPIFADIDLVLLEIGDVVNSFPGAAEAMLRLHTAYKEEQFALADQEQEGVGASGDTRSRPYAAFLSARRNCFPALDAAAEKLSTKAAEALGLADYFKQRYQLRVRRLPSEVMAGSLRRLDWHRKDL